MSSESDTEAQGELITRPDLFPRNVLAIGDAAPRADAYEKATGQTKFAADYYAEDMVWAGVKRAGIPHARVAKIDTSQAEGIPGVMCVLTHRDVSGTNRQGVIRRDQPVLVDDKIRHCGDAVALVVAETRDALRKALDRITLDCPLLTPVLDAEEALEESAALVHEDNPNGNVLLKGELQTGSGDAAEQECEILVEGCFETQRQEHAYLETEAGWAQVKDDGRLEIVCSTQTPFRDRMEVADALGLEPTRVRIVVPYVGGAFGGKDGITVQSLLGLAALKSGGRPVKMWWGREESFSAGAKRHPARMYYRLGSDRSGRLHYLNVRLYLDTGPYDHLGGVVMTLGLEHAGGPYRIPNAVLKAWCVYTNNPLSGAFRGFGVTQVTAAMEQMMDLLAAKLGMDPLELRFKNAVRQGDRNCVGKTLVSSTGLTKCLEALSRMSTGKERDAWKAAAPFFKRRGVGFAALMHASGYGPVVPDFANAKVELTVRGKIRIYSGVVDMGQGNAATNVQIAAAILGQTADMFELIQPDTDRTLASGSASASRCTYTFGNALIGAAEILKNRLVQRAADLMMARKEDIALIPGGIRNLGSGRVISFSQLADFLNEDERVAVHYFRAPVAPDEIGAAPDLKLHGLPHTLFSYGAHAAWIEVDELTGELEVKKYLAVSDCGNILNPQIYEQQIQGAIAQGLGYAVSEDLLVEGGKVLNPDFFTYLIPTSADVPEIVSVPVKMYEITGPFGLKGVGEIATNGPLPALANALADACGIRIFRSPLTPERVLDALNTRNREDLE
ncbi:MAG TPA: xanthine dehydrogenase family protein molybdopterin-binding subunit [Desulfomonilaceae bacterium]|nr:xanthine dehydrogenase family protein molybdopterin-binding subunit [Desulfomonilaceae bacterium]